MRHTHAAFDGWIVFEGQLRSPLQPQLACDARLEDAVGRGEALQRALSLLLRAEDAYPDPSVPKVGRRLDPGHRYESDAGVFQLEEPFRQCCADRLVHTSHSIGHDRHLLRDIGQSSSVTTSRSLRTSSYS